MNEQYKVSKLFPDYEISESGKVRNIKTQRILKQKHDKFGYPNITLRLNNKGKTIKIHKLVADVWLGKSNIPNGVIDHIDQNKDNNYFTNLRLVTRCDNQANRKKFKKTTSMYKGVRKTGKQTYCAIITHNKTKIYLGSFKTEIEAGEAYNKKAKELFGDCASLNIIQ